MRLLGLTLLVLPAMSPRVALSSPPRHLALLRLSPPPQPPSPAVLILAPSHHTQCRDMVSIQMPKPYTSRVRNALAAAPESVDLRNLGGGGGAFYAGGIRLDGL